MARDYFGKELRVGDTVVYICEIQTSANFEEGTIEKVTEKQVKNQRHTTRRTQMY